MFSAFRLFSTAFVTSRSLAAFAASMSLRMSLDVDVLRRGFDVSRSVIRHSTAGEFDLGSCLVASKDAEVIATRDNSESCAPDADQEGPTNETTALHVTGTIVGGPRARYSDRQSSVGV